MFWTKGSRVFYQDGRYLSNVIFAKKSCFGDRGGVERNYFYKHFYMWYG